MCHISRCFFPSFPGCLFVNVGRSVASGKPVGYSFLCEGSRFCNTCEPYAPFVCVCAAKSHWLAGKVSDVSKFSGMLSGEKFTQVLLSVSFNVRQGIGMREIDHHFQISVNVEKGEIEETFKMIWWIWSVGLRVWACNNNRSFIVVVILHERIFFILMFTVYA